MTKLFHPQLKSIKTRTSEGDVEVDQAGFCEVDDALALHLLDLGWSTAEGVSVPPPAKVEVASSTVVISVKGEGTVSDPVIALGDGQPVVAAEEKAEGEKVAEALGDKPAEDPDKTPSGTKVEPKSFIKPSSKGKK